MANSAMNGIRRVWDAVENVFFFTVLAVLSPPFVCGGIIKDQLRQSEKPGWKAVVMAILLMAFTIFVAVCLLGFVLGMVSWEIALGFAGGYFLAGCYIVWVGS